MARFLLILMVAAALIGGGYYAFVMKPPAAPAPVAAAPEPPRTLAATCNVENARYILRGDPSVTLAFEVPSMRAQTLGVSKDAFAFPEMLPTVYAVTAQGRTFRFVAAAARADGAPHLFPIDDKGILTGLRGDDLIAMELTDGAGTVLTSLPQRGYTAPEHIAAPGVSRYIGESGGEPAVVIAPGPFDFQSCDTAVRLQPDGGGEKVDPGYTPPRKL